MDGGTSFPRKPHPHLHLLGLSTVAEWIEQRASPAVKATALGALLFRQQGPKGAAGLQPHEQALLARLYPAANPQGLEALQTWASEVFPNHRGKLGALDAWLGSPIDAATELAVNTALLEHIRRGPKAELMEGAIATLFGDAEPVEIETVPAATRADRIAQGTPLLRTTLLAALVFKRSNPDNFLHPDLNEVELEVLDRLLASAKPGTMVALRRFAQAQHTGEGETVDQILSLLIGSAGKDSAFQAAEVTMARYIDGFATPLKLEMHSLANALFE